MAQPWWISPSALTALARELNSWASSARIQKIYQAGARTVVLDLHHHGVTASLLMRAEDVPRLSLTSGKHTRAETEPPAFQGLLRKHLANARYRELSVEPARRSASLVVDTLQGTRTLVMEWSRDSANLILLHEGGKILGAAQPALLTARGLKVGKPYTPPPEHAVEDVAAPEITAQQISTHPLSAWPTHAAVDLAQQEVQAPKERGALVQARRRVKAELDRVTRLVRALEGDLSRADEAVTLRTAAERAKAQLRDLPRGEPTWNLRDPYDPSAAEITVKVDPALGPHENMERLFHKARRLESTRKHATPRLAESRERAEVLRALIAEIDASQDAAAVEARVAEVLGGKPAPQTGKKAGPSRRMPFRAFQTSQGWRVLCGKTSADNDTLTHRTARGNDIFLHARDAHGAHVILVVEGKPESLDGPIGEAALIAAHFSESRGEAVVDVRWTEVKHVRKVPGRVGMVTLAKERVRRVRTTDPKLAALLQTETGAETRLGGSA
ncbi:MAG: NFACT RNA binding domain-containing protein [Myxococcota bacterium]